MTEDPKSQAPHASPSPTKLSALPVRYSVRELQRRYDDGDKKPLEDLLRAWKGIKELGPDDPNSFFVIGGYHGEPFVGQGSRSPQYWGGYCNHGNVLFPTWHRVYVLRIEQALQSIVPGVMMPYWDETSQDSIDKGIPSILTDEKVMLDGVEIDNPLRSYVLQKGVNDAVKGDDNLYTKDAGYETKRYPLSGLVGTEAARAKTKRHNDQYPDYETNVGLLNENVIAWTKGPEPRDPVPTPDIGIAAKFRACLDAPNYTLFSNTTSAGKWNHDHPSSPVVALESPHNDIHLAVGGFDIRKAHFEAGIIEGANGDMGENNTAGLDPIFFFHHCNVDRMFWLWQVQHGKTEGFVIEAGNPGTNPDTLPNGQGPAAGQDPDEPLSMSTPLKPFLKDSGDPSSYYTSNDCINIETQLGFTYSQGSLAHEEERKQLAQAVTRHSSKALRVSGIDRTLFPGSFVIHAFATIDGQRHWLGYHSVLSRWSVEGCANCQSHLKVHAVFSLSHLTEAQIEGAEFSIEIQQRALPDGLTYELEVTDQ